MEEYALEEEAIVKEGRYLKMKKGQQKQQAMKRLGLAKPEILLFAALRFVGQLPRDSYPF